MKNQLNNLLNRRMDRKDFLKHLGLGVAVVLGMGGILQVFKSNNQPAKRTGSSYGSSTYGG